MGTANNDRATRRAEQVERERQAGIDRSVGQINEVFASPEREAQIADFLAALRTSYGNELGEQKQEVDRESKFALARSGQIGGSLNRDVNKDISRDYTKGVLEAERLAQGGAAELRQADQAAKQNLLAMAFSGLDATTAAQQANLSLQNNLLAGRSRQRADEIGDVFGNFANLYKRSQEMAEERRAKFDFENLYRSRFAPQAGFGGP